MTYQLIVEVDNVDFGQDAGIERHAFVGDALHIEVDQRRFASREHFAAVVSNVVNDAIAAKGDRHDNLTVAELLGDDSESVEAKKAAAKLLLEGKVTQNAEPEHPNDRFGKVVAGVLGFGTPTTQDANLKGIAAAQASGALPTEPRTYSVTWRRPTAAYAHDEIEATSIEDAMMQAKTRVSSRGRFKDEPYFECNTDSMDACDWISVEGDIDDPRVEHVEWEQPKPSAGVLVKALKDITAICDEGSYLGDLFEINRIIQKALIEAIPQ
jgi:hypothetical protein